MILRPSRKFYFCIVFTLLICILTLDSLHFRSSDILKAGETAMDFPWIFHDFPVPALKCQSQTVTCHDVSLPRDDRGIHATLLEADDEEDLWKLLSVEVYRVVDCYTFSAE